MEGAIEKKIQKQVIRRKRSEKRRVSHKSEKKSLT